jgi:hypothetical protein
VEANKVKILLDTANGSYINWGGHKGKGFMCMEGAIGLLATTLAFAQFTPMRPNPQLTPGAVRTSNAAEICAASFRTGPYRHTTSATKQQVYKEYNIEPDKGWCTGGCEVDHLIPLELGGLDDIKDLWPQPSQPKPGFHEKDKLENYLHKQVCSGKMNLSDAQETIRTDWYSAYVKMEADLAKH